jgi:hypothetical protein
VSAGELAGREVQLTGAADPFDATYSAVIRAADVQSNALLLEFATPSLMGGKVYPVAVARPRGGGDLLSALVQHRRLSCNIIWVPSDRFDPARPCDVSWWRGGATATADVVLV